MKMFLVRKKVIWKKQVFEYEVMTSSGVVFGANNVEVELFLSSDV